MRYTLAEFDAFSAAAARRAKRERLQRLQDLRAVEYDRKSFEIYFRALNK